MKFPDLFDDYIGVCSAEEKVNIMQAYSIYQCVLPNNIMLIDDKISTLQSAQNKGFEIRTPMEIGMFEAGTPEKETIYF